MRLRMLLRRRRWRWSWLLVLLLLIHSKEMRRVLLRVLLRLHLRMVGGTRRLDMEGLMWVAIAVLSGVRRMLKLLRLVVRRCRIARLLLLLLVLLNRLPRLMLLNNQSLFCLLGFPNGFGRRRLQLRWNKLVNFTRQILLHLFVNDAVMFYERTYGLILGLVGASFVRAPERLCRGQFFGQFRLEMALGEVPPEVALGLAQITAEVALDHIGGRRRRVWVFDERIARILRLLRNARTRTRRRSCSSAVVTEWRHMIANLDEVAVLRLLLENHRTLLRISGSLHMMRRRLKMVRMLIPALLLLLLLLIEGKLRVIRTDHF